MSVVTNLIVGYDILEHEDAAKMAEFREWFEQLDGIRAIAGGHHDWSKPESWWGGQKNPECELWGGAYNHFDHEAFWSHMNRLGWAYPASVQVFLKDQDDARFQVWMIADGTFARIIDGGTSD
jgi:hypothetical protein